ncbi:MAG: hypothetical protein ACI865_001990 [Flavobacteriaceae bacterium]|jgi:hypothetical protein
MKLLILFLIISPSAITQTWVTQNLGNFSAVSTSPTNQFVIDEHRNAIWLISDSTASVIENDGSVYNFSTTELETNVGTGNLHFEFTSDHIYYSIRQVGLKSFDGYLPSFLFGLADIRELFTDLDTVCMVTDNVLHLYHPTTGAINTEVISSSGNVRKSGHTYIDFGSAAYAIGPFTSVTLTADPTYLPSPMNDFTFERETDTVYVTQQTGISLAYEEQVFDTITPNNTTNMPSENVLDVRFDMNNNLWGIFGDPLNVPFAIARLNGANWMNIYTTANTPINFGNFQGLEFDTLNNLWVAETSRLHTLNSPTTPEWIGIEELTNAQFIVSPNPGREKLNIVSELPMNQVDIIELSGKNVNSETISPSTSYSINASQIQTGTYILRVHFESGSNHSSLWMKE